MATQVVALEASFNTSQAEGSVKSLKAQLKEAQADVQKLADKFGATSDQAVLAAKKAAELKDRIGDAKALTDAFNPDAKFKAFSSAIQGVVGGFSALQGAQALFGNQSEELTKTLAKVQGAMALSQGLNSVLEAKDAFVNLGTVLKTNVVGAFNSLKVAIGSTGIGLLIIAIPILIANFEKIKEVVSNLFPGLAKLGKFFGSLITSVTDFVGITSEAERATKRLIESNKKQIEETDTFLKYNSDKYDDYTNRKIKANNDFKKNQNEILKNDELNDAKKQDQIKQAREFANREIARAEAERQAKAQEALNKQAEERKKLKEQKSAEKTKQDEEDKKAKEEADKKSEDELTAVMEKMEREIEADRKYKEQLDKNSEDELTAEMDRLERQQKADEQYTQTKIELDKIEKENKLKANNEMANSAMALADLLGQQTAVGKGLAVAATTMQTYSAAQDAYKRGLEVPYVGMVLGPLNAGIAIAQGLARVKKILAVKVPGGGGGGGSLPTNLGGGGQPNITAPIQPQASATTLNQMAINQAGNQAIKTYVVESDVSGNQERIDRIQRAARIGP